MFGESAKIRFFISNSLCKSSIEHENKKSRPQKYIHIENNGIQIFNLCKITQNQILLQNILIYEWLIYNS